MFNFIRGLFSSVPRWRISASGNPTTFHHGCRLTVIKGDYGQFCYCLARGEHDENPYFSPYSYKTEVDAKTAAIEDANGYFLD